MLPIFSFLQIMDLGEMITVINITKITIITIILITTIIAVNYGKKSVIFVVRKRLLL